MTALECTFTPKPANCHASNTVPFAVAGRAFHRPATQGHGGVSRNGSVSVRITVGASWANGSGRLAGNSGARPMERGHYRDAAAASGRPSGPRESSFVSRTRRSVLSRCSAEPDDIIQPFPYGPGLLLRTRRKHSAVEDARVTALMALRSGRAAG